MKALRRANPNEERIEDVLDAQIGKVLRISLMSDDVPGALFPKHFHNNPCIRCFAVDPGWLVQLGLPGIVVVNNASRGSALSCRMFHKKIDTAAASRTVRRGSQL